MNCWLRDLDFRNTCLCILHSRRSVALVKNRILPTNGCTEQGPKHPSFRIACRQTRSVRAPARFPRSRQGYPVPLRFWIALPRSFSCRHGTGRDELRLCPFCLSLAQHQHRGGRVGSACSEPKKAAAAPNRIIMGAAAGRR